MFCCADAHVKQEKKKQLVKGELLKGIGKMAKKIRQDREVIEESQFE